MAYNVLVVDDSAVMRGMIVKTLRLSGLALGEIHQAANGAEGLKTLAENQVDLALVDINMPVMNGEEMIDRVRACPTISGLPVIVVSTEASETRLEALRGKGAEFIHKPFHPEILRDMIRNMTGANDDSISNEDQFGSGFATSDGYDF